LTKNLDSQSHLFVCLFAGQCALAVVSERLSAQPGAGAAADKGSSGVAAPRQALQSCCQRRLGPRPRAAAARHNSALLLLLRERLLSLFLVVSVSDSQV